MLFTPVGRTSVSRAVPRNAQLPIVSTVLGIFTSVRAALLAKAASPIDTSPSGRCRVRSCSQTEMLLEPICRIDVGSVRLSNARQ